MSAVYALQRLSFPQLLAGQWTALRSSADEALTLARSVGQPTLTAAPVAWLTLLAALQGTADYENLLADLEEVADPAGAAEWFETALAHHRNANRPFDQARTQLAYGEFPRRARRRVDARTHLRAALETFTDLNAGPLIARTTQELRASGETARKRDPSTLLQLTPMELKVAQLVSTGGFASAGRRLPRRMQPRNAQGCCLCDSLYREGVETPTVCAFVTRGLEDIAAAEIGETSAAAGGIETRPKVVLTQACDVRGLRRLRTVDDVAVVSASSPSVHDLQALLSLVTEQADLEKTIEQALRTDRLDGTFSITVSVAHVPYGTSGAIEDAVASAISARYEWRYTELQRAPIDIRVFIDGTWALVGVRLFDEPLSRRRYRVVNLYGALRPTVAAALVRIASPGRGRPRIWDPFCGSATILCEAAEQGHEVWGTDIDPEAVKASRENLTAVNREYGNRIECADSTSLKTWKKHQSATAVVTNLPWGKQVAIKSKQALYDSVSAGTAELVRRGGTSVLLTTEPKLIRQRLKRDDAVRIEERRIGLLGQTPTILAVQPA